MNEIKFQRESGVIDMLVSQPYNERHIDYGLKQATMISMWARPTIQWED